MLSDPATMLTRQSCEWLVELTLRLHVVIEVLDAHDVPVCPVGSAPDAALVRRMLTGGEPVIREAISDASRSSTPVTVAIEGLQVRCFRLAPGGTLIVGKRTAPDESVEECQEDLESIGTWLTGAVEAGLAQPTAVAVEPYRLMSFRRILREATLRGSVRSVIGAFVEALSVWDDLHVRVFVAGEAGGLVPYASALGASPSPPTEHLDEALVPRTGRLVRLSRADVDRLGVALDSGDVLVLRLLVGETACVLVFSGMIDDRAQQMRLRVYSDILRESLNDVLTATINRVIAGVSRRELPVNEPLETAVLAALGHLSTEVGGRRAALIVTTAAGGEALAVGNTDLLPTIEQACPTRLVVRSSDADGVLAVVIDRDQAPFTAFEREIVRAGIATVHPWVQAVLRRPRSAERRRSSRPVDRMFDELATEAVAAGQHASVIVLSVDSAAARPGLLPSWVGRIRGQLRGGDRAGLLSDQEIAVLLCGASADQAAVVSARLQQLVGSGDDEGQRLHPAIGITTRVPESPFNGSLVGAARASATAVR
jgi:hypothetical protein